MIVFQYRDNWETYSLILYILKFNIQAINIKNSINVNWLLKLGELFYPRNNMESEYENGILFNKIWFDLLKQLFSELSSLLIAND